MQQLSSHDVAVWRAIAVHHALEDGRLDQVVPVIPPFAPRRRDEVFLGTGPFQLSEYIAAGDGSYMHNSGWFFATGGAGLALSAGVMAARAIGNARRRAQAEAAAREQWRMVDTGVIWVSTHGFLLHTPRGLLSWTWEAVDSVMLMAEGAAVVTGRSERGPVQWLVESDWSELLFTMWCRARHPQHPQFTSWVWIPAGFADRVRAAGQVPPPHPSQRALGR